MSVVDVPLKPMHVTIQGTCQTLANVLSEEALLVSRALFGLIHSDNRKEKHAKVDDWPSINYSKPVSRSTPTS